MICPNCGSGLPDGAAFCGACGSPVIAQPAPPDRQTVGVNHQQPNLQPQPPQGYQQSQGYGAAQPATPPMTQQEWAPQTATNRAFAMTLYVASLLGVIFALCVRDKDNAFITHHLNNAVVILIGSMIGAILSIVLVGFVLLIYLLIMVIMGIVSAYNGDTKELPLVGKIHIVR